MLGVFPTHKILSNRNMLAKVRFFFFDSFVVTFCDCLFCLPHFKKFCFCKCELMCGFFVVLGFLIQLLHVDLGLFDEINY